MTVRPGYPIYFGPTERLLFGWLSVPKNTAAQNIGIVLCNPLGYEAICTHRTYRHIAARAHELGFPVLRFDYDGTGNSSGEDLDSQRVSAWLESIHYAIEALKSNAGIERVCLLGLRMGATLAVAAAIGRNDIAALVALAPVIAIRTYLREIRALAMARAPRASTTEENPTSTLQEAAGFITQEETRNDLSKIDLVRMDAAPADNVLIVERDDLPNNGNWPAHLASIKVKNVERAVLTGYAEMMLDAHASVVPSAAIEHALNWVKSLQIRTDDNTHKNGDTVKQSSAINKHYLLPTNASFAQKVLETPVFLDDQATLFGIVSEPAVAAPINPATKRQVLILLNSGTIHHIGPHRLYVTLARACALHGFTVIRIDVSGIGESLPRGNAHENLPYSSHVAQDIVHATGFVANRFKDADLHVAGVCSGAYHGLKAAVQGVPLRSVVAINPLTFFWKDGMSLEYADFHVTSEVNRYKKSAFELSSWLKVLKGETSILPATKIFLRRLLAISRNSGRELGRLAGIAFKEDLASELIKVARHGIDLYFVFSTSDPGLAMLREQGGRTVGKLSRRNALRIDLVPGADHTFTARQDRERVVDLLVAHIQSQEQKRQNTGSVGSNLSQN